MTQNTLIAIVNARHRSEWRDAVRSTWKPQVPEGVADALFFVGRGEPLADPEDVIELDCSDKYEHLPEKIRAIARWALEHGYGHMLKDDDDVILRPVDLLNSGYEKYDYSGRANRPPQPYDVPYGFNYWLSKRSMGHIADADLPSDGSNDDEKWVAKVLWDHGIKLFDDRRYHLYQTKLPDETTVPYRRPLRMPRAPKRDIPIQPQIQKFSWCIHIPGETSEKITEFNKVFKKYGGEL